MKQILRLVVTLFLITSVVASALAGVNAVTKDKIAAAREEKNQKAMRQVLPDGDNLKSISFSDDTGMVRQVYAPDGKGDAGAYAVKVVAAGFGGEVTMMVGIKDGTVAGVSVVSHSETPSLGAVAAAESSKGIAFRDQFVGMSGALAVTKDGGAVDAITGATITSRAVTEGVNAALACVNGLE